MKVLKIIHTQGHGGAENAFRWLAWGLLQEGVEVTAAVPRAILGRENWIGPALKELGVPTLTFDKSGGPLQMYQALSELIIRTTPDLVHSHLLDSNFYGALACWRHAVPHVCTEHGDIFLDSSARTRIKYRTIARLSRCVVCVSQAVAERTGQMVRRPGQLKTVYNGIHFIEPAPSTFRQECAIPAEAPLIGSVGNLYPVKGQRHLVEAFGGLLAESPELRLVLVGRGAEEQSLKELVQRVGIPSQRVIFTGFRKDVANILNSLDLYVQPSLSEGHPLAVLEAMSLGLPVIASAVGGMPELLHQGRYGTLVPAGSSGKLQQAIGQWLREPAPFRDKGLAGRDYIREAHSIRGMARTHVAIYRQLTGGGGGGR